LKIFRSKVDWSHSFQELITLWEKKGFCEVVETKEQCSWGEELGGILLYEHDGLSSLPVDWDIALFANEVYNGSNTSPWVYWPKHPKKMADSINEFGIYNFDQRNISSIFLGKVQNTTQLEKRTSKNWNESVEVFSMPIELNGKSEYKTPYEDYLSQIRNSKFGLCLSGCSLKSSREIELMGSGTVPIFTENVDNKYFEPLRENYHYFYAEHPQQVEDIINSCSKEQWREMSAHCVDWYFRNASIEGSFETTEYIIQELRKEKNGS